MPNSIVKLNEMKPVDSAAEWKQNISLFASSNVIINAKTRSAYFDEHWGPLSIKCAFNGEEHYYSKNFHLTVDDKRFVVFNEGKIYGSFIDSEHEVESFTIHFSPEFHHTFLHSLSVDGATMLNDPFEIKRRDTFFCEQVRTHDNFVSPLLFQIRDLTRHIDYVHQGLVSDLHVALLNRLVAGNANVGIPEEISALRHSTRVELSGRLKLAREFILDNYHLNLSVEEISRVACMNKFHFIRQFKSAYNTTPHQFIMRLRLQAAARQLRSSTKSVTEVSHEIGLADLAAFSKLFKKYYKFSPSEFQRNFGSHRG